MARLTETDGKKAECYGVRLPAGYSGKVPAPLLIIDVPAADYIVFEHGAFNYEQETETVGEKLQAAIDGFDYGGTDRAQDDAAGRLSYFHCGPAKWEKRVFPVKRA
jgi:hypothetical protein